MAEQESINTLLNKIRQNVQTNPKNLEPVITELNSIINKYDPEIKENKSSQLPLFPKNYELQPDEILNRIQTKSGLQTLKIPQIRFKADELSKKLQIPLPNSTRKHKEPLLMWFNINWDSLEQYIAEWGSQEIPDAG